MNSTNDPDEDELREHLRAWGRDTEQRSPAFHGVWRGARQSLAQREIGPGSLPLSWALAAAAAVVGVMAMVWTHHQPSSPALVAEQSIVATGAAPITASAFDPTAPTDFLLTVADGSNTPSVPQLTREINALLTP